MKKVKMQADRRQFLIGKLLHLRFELVDRGNQWLDAFDLSIMFGAKDFGKRTFDHKEVNTSLAGVGQERAGNKIRRAGVR